MELTEDQRFEKAVQHIVVFALYMQTSEKLVPAATHSALLAAAERVAGASPSNRQGSLI